MRLLLLLCLLFSLSVFTTAGQQLPRGTFVYADAFTRQEFTFKSMNRFSYFYSTCTGGREGRGTYVFKDSLLTLTFKNPANKAKIPSKPVIDLQPDSGDTVLLNFKFFNQKDRTPVPYVVTAFQCRSDNKKYGTVANDSGFAKLWIRQADLPANVEISSIGMDTDTLFIDEPGIYSIAFPMNFEHIKMLGEGDELSFIVGNYSKSKICLNTPFFDDRFRMHQKKINR